MDLSVIIVSYNVQYFLEQCLLSIQEASKGLKVEVIVVDNNSTDATCKNITSKFPLVRLLSNQNNIGFSKANNQGVKIAKGEYVLILNPDTVVAEDTFLKVLNFAKEKQNLGVLGVKLIDGAGNFAPESKRGIPTPMVSFYKLFGISGKRTGKYYATHLTEDETGVVEVCSGAFMFLKRTVYNEVNGFNEAYFMYGEDIDLSIKLINSGYQNYYFSNTQIIHYKGESTQKNLRYLSYFYDAMKIFYNKHFKLNRLYDFFMKFGIDFWYFLKLFKYNSPRKTASKRLNNYLYLGDNENIVVSLERKNYKVKRIQKFGIDTLNAVIKDNSIEVVLFDNDIILNKEIIYYFQQLKNKKVLFKIHPRTTNFLISSTSPNSRGEVDLL
jgi:GT2 family glycosyltransferase